MARTGKRARRWVARPPVPECFADAWNLAREAFKILESIPLDLGHDVAHALFDSSEISERRIAQFLDALVHNFHDDRRRTEGLFGFPVPDYRREPRGAAAQRLLAEVQSQPRRRPPAVPGRPGYLREIVVKYKARPIPYGARTIGGRIRSSADVYKLFAGLRDEAREHIFAVHLNAEYTVLSVDHVSIGELGSAPLNMTSLIRNAFLAGAAHVIVLHNHPLAQAPEPSDADAACLHQLHRACEFVGLPLEDFMIVGEGGYWSAKDHSILVKGHLVPPSIPLPRRGRPRRTP